MKLLTDNYRKSYPELTERDIAEDREAREIILSCKRAGFDNWFALKAVEGYARVNRHGRAVWTISTVEDFVRKNRTEWSLT